jgi:hypothetical protein
VAIWLVRSAGLTACLRVELDEPVLVQQRQDALAGGELALA